MINELVAFYKIVANNEKLKNLVTNTDDISWIDIYDDEINDLHMGISQDGIWILKYRKIFICLMMIRSFYIVQIC